MLGGADGEDVIMPGPYLREFRDVVVVARGRESGVTTNQIATDCR
jgi:hypothetical protein